MERTHKLAANIVRQDYKRALLASAEKSLILAQVAEIVQNRFASFFSETSEGFDVDEFRRACQGE